MLQLGSLYIQRLRLCLSLVQESFRLLYLKFTCNAVTETICRHVKALLEILNRRIENGSFGIVLSQTVIVHGQVGLDRQADKAQIVCAGLIHISCLFERTPNSAPGVNFIAEQ